MITVPTTGRAVNIWAMVPTASATVAVIIDAVWRAGIGAPAPCLTILVILFWSSRRPDLLGPASALALTALVDILTALPPGLTGTAILLARWLLLPTQPPARARPFFLAWCQVTIVLATVELLRWAIACLYWQHAFRPLPLVHEAALTTAFWPFLTVLLGPLAARLPRGEHAPGS